MARDEEKKGFAEGYWSDEDIKETYLEEQRAYMWNEDYFRNVLAPLFKLEADSCVLDVGCGLGFLGLKIAELVPKGRIVGVDLDPKLVDAARKKAASRRCNTAFDFKVGNAYALPVEDDSVDLAICQTLLMHLDEPTKAISEMRRVTKQNGRVIAIEPDYSGHSFFDTSYEAMNLSLEKRVKLWRWDRILSAGKKKLGRGDNEIGSKVPHLFLRSGLHVVDVRSLDKAFWLVPPYEGKELQLRHMTMAIDVLVEKLDVHTEFVAGGGTEEEWTEYYGVIKQALELTKQQVKDRSFVSIVLPAAAITVGEKR